jgi:circadian clock protein KaiC
MKTTPRIARLPTGIRNLDDLLNGGLPQGSVTVIAGPPGAGKTILAQQICFHNASAERRVLYVNTLSEPTAKTLRYLRPFRFFDAARMDKDMHFVDLGVILRSQGLEESASLIMEQVRKTKAAIIVIDTFRVFDDLSESRERLRKFGYELAINLMAWEATAFLLGEFGPRDIATNPLFSIIDGMILMHQREQSGEQQRFIQVAKMRGTNHSRDEHPFVITEDGIEVFAPRVTIRREARDGEPTPRLKTGISKLDDLLGAGIPRGSSLLVSGVAGTGKTALGLEFVYRGARLGEKGILFSFEETGERLRAAALGFGWDLDAEIERGMVEIVFIPQPDILVEGHLLMMRERVAALQARRVVIDSVSVFLHKIKDARTVREKMFQLATIVHNEQAVGLFATDIPFGSTRISRFGVEETVVDGVLLLSSTEEGFERQRYLEVYKLRNTAHLKGRHSMTIGPGGITVYPRYEIEAVLAEPPPPVEIGSRLPTGVPGLDVLLGGGLFERSVTLVSGSAGIGKSTLALQFVAAGAARGEAGLYVALEEGPSQIVSVGEALGLPLRAAVEQGLIEVIYLPRERVRTNQLLSLLTDRIRAQGTRRFVLDSISHLGAGALSDGELRQLLCVLVARFKALGVTSLLTLESPSMFSSENVTDQRFSPIADNLIALRYVKLAGESRPTLAVVKTRGTAHDFGTFYFDIGEGGVRIGSRAGAGDAADEAGGAGKGRGPPTR